MIDKIKERIKSLEEHVEGIDKMYEEGFDPDDWSGGNFDDCYDLGHGHGEYSGELRAYSNILGLLEEEKRI